MAIVTKIKSWVAKLIDKRGYRITKQPLSQYLHDFKINCVLDVGANEGQYANEIRETGYCGRIESFEPLPSVLMTLRRRASADKMWSVHPFALGSKNETLSMNVSNHSPSSSFLPMSENIYSGSLDRSTVDSANVEVKRLDDVFPDLCNSEDRVLLKIDTQGFERNVVEGGLISLQKVAIIQMEVALLQNYSGESLIEDMIGLMRREKFVPWWIMDGFRNSKTQQLYQVDVFFVRPGLPEQEQKPTKM